jgi:hypothetical protein
MRAPAVPSAPTPTWTVRLAITRAVSGVSCHGQTSTAMSGTAKVRAPAASAPAAKVRAASSARSTQVSSGRRLTAGLSGLPHLAHCGAPESAGWRASCSAEPRTARGDSLRASGVLAGSAIVPRAATPPTNCVCHRECHYRDRQRRQVHGDRGPGRLRKRAARPSSAILPGVAPGEHGQELQPHKQPRRGHEHARDAEKREQQPRAKQPIEGRCRHQLHARIVPRAATSRGVTERRVLDLALLLLA